MLPPEYVAGPHVHLGPEVEIDVATFEAPSHPAARTLYSQPDDGGVATAVWPPTEPTLSVETELSDFDEYEVWVYDTRHGRRLVAIELISPSNKDRPEHRSQFTSKCAMLLRQGVSLVLVDVVTAQRQPIRRTAGSGSPIGSFIGYRAACDLRRRLPLAGAGKEPMAGDLVSWVETWAAVAVSPLVVDGGPGNTARSGSELRADVP